MMRAARESVSGHAGTQAPPGYTRNWASDGPVPNSERIALTVNRAAGGRASRALSARLGRLIGRGAVLAVILLWSLFPHLLGAQHQPEHAVGR